MFNKELTIISEILNSIYTNQNILKNIKISLIEVCVRLSFTLYHGIFVYNSNQINNIVILTVKIISVSWATNSNQTILKIIL